MARRKPFIVRLLLGILIFIAVILVLLVLWMGFAYFDKKNTVSVLPKNSTIYVRTDSFWNAAEPLVDLKAVDILLSDPQFVQFRELFLSLRESKVRNSNFIAFALSRRIDAALYENNDYLAIIDMGLFAGITRASPLYLKFIHLDNLSYNQNGDKVIEYQAGDKFFYGKTVKNLVVLSSSKELLEKSTDFDNRNSYSENELKLVSEKLDKPFRITADSKKLLSLIAKENEDIAAISSYISSDELSTINFGINDSKINIDINIPFTVSEENQLRPVGKLLQKNSKSPVLLSKLPEAVQYYTFITAGSLKEMKEAAFDVLASKNDLQKKWQNASNVSQMLFNLTADELLFSWTGDEYAILGIEGKSEPVFVVKISDEKQREYIFDTILSSIILKSDSSLLLDGIRLPRIEMPSFFQSVLECFKVSLPKPYYMVKDNYIYFSQSPENLASINAAIKGGTKLSRNEAWQKISENQSSECSVDLFYNLERSVPFFIKGSSTVSKILQLYNIGKTDIAIKDNTLNIKLNAAAIENTSVKTIPGFPVELSEKTNASMYKSVNEKSSRIFFVQENKALCAFNTNSLELNKAEIEEIAWCKPANESAYKRCGGEVWAVTKGGTVYLLDGSLKILDNFPLLSGIQPCSAPESYNDGILLVSDDGLLVFVSCLGNRTEIQIDCFNEINSSPAVYKNSVLIYEGGFTGSIYRFDDIKADSVPAVTEVQGIAYGEPAAGEINREKITAIITQTGRLYAWDMENNLKENFPLQIDDIFYLNVKICNDFMVALSENGTLYKIDLQGNVTPETIPYLSAKTGCITITDYDNDKDEEIFVCGEGNIIYGFNKNLEFLNGFPVSGYGIPVFTDVNGDKKTDCLTLSVDNKLNGWNIR